MIKLLSLSIILFYNLAAFGQSIAGDWRLVARKCSNSKNWETVNGVTTSINLDTNTYNLVLLEDGCELTKVGIMKQTSPSTISFCKPLAHITGACSKRLIDHVIAINNLKDSCEENRTIELSDSNNKLNFYEEIRNPGLACEVGQKLEYNFERILPN